MTWSKLLFGGAFLILLLVFSIGLRQPLLVRDWTVDQAIPATVTFFDDDTVAIQNVRNFTYRSTTDYTPGYYDTIVDLNDLERVDYIVEPFGDIGAAHNFLSFGFKDGQQIAVSVEIRKEKGETFSPLKGLLSEYELMYVIADERDVIDLRVRHRQHDVYLYPTTATREQARELFVNMLSRANAIMEEPEFYNTFFNNCTTNIAAHINELSPGRIPLDPRLILPAYSDALAKELGFIAPDLSLMEARQRYRVNDRVLTRDETAPFSVAIRERAEVESEIGEVVAVLDGDTIEVLVGGVKKRVRYIGVDTPEMHYDAPPAECLAEEAKVKNEELVGGKEVFLRADVGDTDAYGRLLRYVSVNGEDVGTTLLKEGYAKTLTIPPNVERATLYKEIEKESKEARLGLWGEVCLP